MCPDCKSFVPQAPGDTPGGLRGESFYSSAGSALPNIAATVLNNLLASASEQPREQQLADCKETERLFGEQPSEQEMGGAHDIAYWKRTCEYWYEQCQSLHHQLDLADKICDVCAKPADRHLCSDHAPSIDEYLEETCHTIVRSAKIESKESSSSTRNTAQSGDNRGLRERLAKVVARWNSIADPQNCNCIQCTTILLCAKVLESALET